MHAHTHIHTHSYTCFIPSLFLWRKLMVEVFWYLLLCGLFFFPYKNHSKQLMISHRKKKSFECWKQNKTQKRTTSLRLFKNWSSRSLQHQDLTKFGKVKMVYADRGLVPRWRKAFPALSCRRFGPLTPPASSVCLSRIFLQARAELVSCG